MASLPFSGRMTGFGPTNASVSGPMGHTAQRIELRGESVRKLYAHRDGDGKKRQE